jgi:hypothetical protein
MKGDGGNEHRVILRCVRQTFRQRVM